MRTIAAWALGAAPWSAAIAAEPLDGATLVKVIVGLAVVLAVFGAAAYLLKRAGAPGASRSGTLRIVDALAIGARERLVLVEVDGERVLLGMGPGQMCALHHLGTAARHAPDPKSAQAAPDEVRA